MEFTTIAAAACALVGVFSRNVGIALAILAALASVVLTMGMLAPLGHPSPVAASIAVGFFALTLCAVSVFVGINSSKMTPLLLRQAFFAIALSVLFFISTYIGALIYNLIFMKIGVSNGFELIHKDYDFAPGKYTINIAFMAVVIGVLASLARLILDIGFFIFSLSAPGRWYEVRHAKRDPWRKMSVRLVFVITALLMIFTFVLFYQYYRLNFSSHAEGWPRNKPRNGAIFFIVLTLGIWLFREIWHHLVEFLRHGAGLSQSIRSISHLIGLFLAILVVCGAIVDGRIKGAAVLLFVGPVVSVVVVESIAYLSSWIWSGRPATDSKAGDSPGSG